MTTSRNFMFFRGETRGRSHLIAAAMFVTAFVAAQNLFAYDGTEWIGDVGWRYSVENGEATISNAVRPNPDLIPGIGIYYGPAGGDLVVPATVGNGIPVTTVMGAGGNELMTGLTIPAGVRTIGSWAFRWNFALAYVTIPDTVTDIDEYAFQECTNLTQITLPPRLAKIGEGAFARCYNLNRVVIPSTLKSISIDAFRECDALREVLIPNGVEEIGESAFSLCRSLTDVTIPASVKSCGSYAFASCSGLKRATLNAVGPSDYMFLNCTSLTDVTIPEGAVGVGIGSFWGCSSLRSIVLPRSLKFVDSKAFKDCTSLQRITMPRDCYRTYTDAYAGCPETLQFVFWEDGGGSGTGGGQGGGEQGAVPVDAASEYNGYFVDAKGSVVGTILVKVGKPNAKTGLAAVKASVVIGAAKKSLKADGGGKAEIAANGSTTIQLVGGDPCAITLGAEGLSGSYGAYQIDGARNLFASKDKGEQNAADAVLGKWLGAVNVVWDGGVLTVTIAKKGKVKVSGTIANGTKATGNAVFTIGEEWAYVPVVLPKANISFAMRLSLDGGEVVVNGLGDDVVAGRGGALKAGAKFRIDEDEFAAVTGIAALPYLPDGVEVKQDGAKWVVAGGAKAGKVAYLRGTQEVDEAKLGDNPSGLKLTYKAKDGSFKGSFKVYAAVNGKLKATTVSVSGIVLNGVGYGTAAVKGKGSVPVTIE